VVGDLERLGRGDQEGARVAAGRDRGDLEQDIGVVGAHQAQ
jgi:hypothetical protein